MPKLIADLAIMLLTAALVAVIFKRFKQPLVLGYILVGFLVGPFMPYFFTVEDTASIETWSEIGIIVLMFSLGLEFNLHKLFSVGKTAIITAMTEVMGMLVVGYLVGQAMGWGMMNSLFLGGMLSMSSTTIIIKAFDELGVTGERYAQLVFGTLVIEDIAGIFMMIILSTASVSKSISGGALALKLGVMIVYLVLWLIIGIYVLPTLLRKAADFINDEVLLLLSLGLCFGMVMLAEHLGFSSALGAFMAGSLLAGTVNRERIEHLSSGIKDLFGAVFFLSVGMLINPAMLVKYIVPILLIAIVTIIGKLTISALGVILSGESLRTAVACGCSLAQIGEFAFIIASLGLSLGVIKDFVYPIIVAVSVITTLTTPFCIKHSEAIYGFVSELIPNKSAEASPSGRSDTTEKEQENDWAGFISKFLRTTSIFGILMIGSCIIGAYVVYPLLKRTPLDEYLIQGLSLFFCAIGIALFTRPMLDMHSTEYTALWVKNRANRLPLMTFTAIRFMVITIIAFFAVQSILRIRSFWLLIVILLVVVLIYKSGWMASAYISAEARFMANLNERNLNRDTTDGVEWLDEKLFVEEFIWNEGNRTLKDLSWGYYFSVNVIKIIRRGKHIDMPDGKVMLQEGDRIFALGKAEDIRSFLLAQGRNPEGTTPTLREFIRDRREDAEDIVAYALPVEKGSKLDGMTIKDTELREIYDCMILGLQRDRLPILQPDVNMTIQRNDMLWILGTRKMAERLLLKEI